MKRAKTFVGIARWPVSFVAWAAIGAATALLVAVTVPTLFGMKPFTVLSGSMEPTFNTGDIVIDRAIPAGQIKVGDVITFREPDSTRLITHRVREISVTNNSYHVTTKGDANHTVETWNIDASGKVGRAQYHVPKMGYVMAWIRTPLGRVILIVIPALLLAGFELTRIWRRQGPETSSEARA